MLPETVVMTSAELRVWALEVQGWTGLQRLPRAGWVGHRPLGDDKVCWNDTAPDPTREIGAAFALRDWLLSANVKGAHPIFSTVAVFVSEWDANASRLARMPAEELAT